MQVKDLADDCIKPVFRRTINNYNNNDNNHDNNSNNNNDNLLRDCSYENNFCFVFPLNCEKDIISSHLPTTYYPGWARFILASC